MMIDASCEPVQANQRLHQQLQAYLDLFNRLETYRGASEPAERLQRDLSELVTPQIRFQDPFGTLQGIEPLARYLLRFTEQVGQPRFETLKQGWDGDCCLVLWRFSGDSRWFADASGRWQFDGVSRIVFNRQGLIEQHIDYWDAGEAVYQRLPLLGGVIRRLRQKLHQG